MKQFKAALFLSLGLFSINAWSNTTEFLMSPTAALVLGVILFVCLIIMASQKSAVNKLKAQIKDIESANEKLSTTNSTLNQTIESLKKESQSGRTTKTPSRDSASNQNPIQQLNTGEKFDEALIDISVGIKKVRGKEDRYLSLLDEFVSRKPSLVNQLTEYVGKGEMLRAKEFAHTMKEQTGDLALDSLHFCLSDLEIALIEDDLTAIHQKLVDLGRAWRITEREVQKYLVLKSA